MRKLHREAGEGLIAHVVIKASEIEWQEYERDVSIAICYFIENMFLC